MLGVVLGLDVVPGKLAEAHQAEPGAEQREVVQRLGLVLEGRDLVVHHVHEDQPGLVVLRPLVGERVTALLRQRLLGLVTAEYSRPFTCMPKSRMNWRSPQPFSANSSCMYLTPCPAMRPKPSPRAIWWSSSTCDAPLPQRQVEPARPLQVQDAALEALHRERAAGAERNRVDTVGVAVEVRLRASNPGRRCRSWTPGPPTSRPPARPPSRCGPCRDRSSPCGSRRPSRTPCGSRTSIRRRCPA